MSINMTSEEKEEKQGNEKGGISVVIENENDKTKNSPKKTDVVNVVMLSVSFFLLFSAFNTAQAYMTSLHPENGHSCLGLLYITFAAATFFGPSILAVFGNKASLIFGAFFYLLMTFATGIVGFDVFLFFTSFLVGVGAPLVWSANGSILVASSGDKLPVMSGLFFAIYSANQLAGFLLSAVLKLFGLEIYLIFIIYGWIGFLGIALMFFLKSCDDVDTNKPKLKEQVESMVKVIFSTAKLLFDLRFLLLVPSIFHLGYSFAFIYGSITSKVGSDTLGWLMSVFALSSIVGSYGFGKMNQDIGYRWGFHLTFFFQILALIYTFTLDSGVLFVFVTLVFVGFGDSGLNTTSYAIFGKYFKENTAAGYSAYKLIQSLSASFQFYTEKIIPMEVTQYVLIGTATLSVVSFIVLDVFISPVDKFGNGGKPTNLNLLDFLMNCRKKSKQIQ